jgi:hypothetical protein
MFTRNNTNALGAPKCQIICNHIYCTKTVRRLFSYVTIQRDEIRVYPKDHRTSRVEEQAPGAVIETPAPDEVSDKTLDSREIEQLRRQVDVLRGLHIN